MNTPSLPPFSSLSRDLAHTKRSLQDLTDLSKTFSKVTLQAFSSVKMEGKSLSSYLNTLILSISKRTLSSALKPLSKALLPEGFSSVLSPLLGKLVPFAKGGVVGSPTVFPLPGGVGLTGEAGPEAILPLSRGADGRLGVKSGGTGQRPLSLTVHIHTPDVGNFQKSQSQISATLAQALRRGSRNL